MSMQLTLLQWSMHRKFRCPFTACIPYFVQISFIRHVPESHNTWPGEVSTLSCRTSVLSSSPILSCHPCFAHFGARCHLSCQDTSAKTPGTGEVSDVSSTAGDGVSNDSETCDRLTPRWWRKPHLPCGTVVE